MFELNDEIKVIKNNDPDYDFLVGKIGFISEIRPENQVVISFYYDEMWASYDYLLNVNDLIKMPIL